MEVSWDLYKIFYFVCEFKNLTKVANYFYLTQPAITKKIKTLESQLNTNLVISSNKGIKITDEGMKLYEEIKHACEIFNDVDLKYTGVSNDVNKTITISGGYMTIDKVLMPAIFTYNKKHPEVRFKVETCDFEESLKKLKSGEIDLFFYGHDRLKPDSDSIVTKECFEVTNSFIVSSQIRNQFPEKISIYDLNDYPLIMKDKSGQSRMLLERVLEEKGIELQPKYEVTSYWAIRGFIDANMGIGYLYAEYFGDKIKERKMGNNTNLRRNSQNFYLRCLFKK